MCSLPLLWGHAGAVFAEQVYPDAIRIVAPDGLSTRILKSPSATAEVLAIALDGDILEAVGKKNGYVAVRMPDLNSQGYVLEKHTVPWVAPVDAAGSPLVPILIGLLLMAVALAAYVIVKFRKRRELERDAAIIAESIKRAEDFFRSCDYASAIVEFNKHVELQDGDVRNPDVYRRLTVSYHKTGDNEQAARCWEKMKELGGLKGNNDYDLGVQIMTALGEDARAAKIYEQLLAIETGEDRIFQLRMELFEIYRRVKDPEKLLEHSLAMTSGGAAEQKVVTDTVHFLISEGETDRAIESDNEELVTRICGELVEDKALSPEAERIYLKCLEYDRTNTGIHRLLAEKYRREGDFRKAVSELIILEQIDKRSSSDYVAQAAQLYMDNFRVPDALAEGNPKIIKQLAKIFLARSDVSPDAVAVYEKILDFQPNAVGVNRMLSTVYLTRGDLTNYMAKLRLLHEIDGSHRDYLADLARCVIDNRLVEETMREGNRSLNAKILKQLIKMEAHDDKTVMLLELLVRREPDNAVMQGALARAYHKRGEQGKELEALLALGKLKPDDKKVSRRAAEIAVENDLLDSVLESGTAEILVATARELIDRKAEGPKCRQVLARALEREPDNKSIREFLGPHHPSPESAREQRDAKELSHARSVRRAAPGPSASKRPKTTTPPKAEKPPGRVEKPSSKEKDRKEEPRPSEKPEMVADRKKVRKPGAAKKKRKKNSPAKHDKPEATPLQTERVVKVAPSPTRPPEDKPVTTFVSAYNKATADPGESAVVRKPPAQVVRMTISSDSSPEDRPVTTFVSAHAEGRTQVQFREEELFHALSGGLAYHAVQPVCEDGWGSWHIAAEVNTGKKSLLRVFDKGIMRLAVIEEVRMKEFLLEVSRLASSMTHENILELKEVVTGPGDTGALVYSYLPRNVEQRLRSGEPTAPELRMQLVKRIVDAVAYAHSHEGPDGKFRRTYHLHLQPSQIFVTDDLDTCKVAGFGYSQIYRELTRAGQPRWKDPGVNAVTMPPEFFRSTKRVARKRAAEIYSLGVMSYFILAGEFPFDGPSFDDYKFQHLRIEPAPPRLVNPSVPDWVESLIMECLVKDPSKRMQSVFEFQQVLDRESIKGGN